MVLRPRLHTKIMTNKTSRDLIILWLMKHDTQEDVFDEKMLTKFERALLIIWNEEIKEFKALRIIR